jgi:dienelactone hydrolase
MTRWKRNLLVAVLSLGWFWTLLGNASLTYLQRTIQHRETLDRGFVSRTCYRADQPNRKYLVFIPHVQPPEGLEKYPVILFLNGRGENGNDGVSQIANNFGRPIWEFQETFPFIAVMPQCPPIVHWTEPEQIEIALDTLEDVLSDYPADPERVSITGASAGGSAALALALEHPELFCAVVPISASLLTDPTSTAAACQKAMMPVWMAFNAGDSIGLVDQCRAFERELAKHNCSYRSVAYERSDHDAWNFAYRDPSLYAWLLQQRQTGSIDHGTAHPREREANQSFALDAFTENSIIELDSQLTNPLEITISPTDEANHTLQTCRIASLDDGFSDDENTSGSSQDLGKYNGGSLLARGSIRVGQWNHLALSRSSERWRIELNGWPFAEGSLSPRQPYKVEFRRDAPAPQEGPEIRNLRRRVASVARPGHAQCDFLSGWDSTFLLKSPLLESPREPIQIRSEPYISADLLSELKKRETSAIDQTIRWTVQSRSAADSYPSELTINADGFYAKSIRQWFGGRQSTPTNHPIKSFSIDFLRALAEQFAMEQPIKVPRIAFTRHVTGDRWMDSWQFDSLPTAVTHELIMGDATSVIRLTPESQSEYQLNTLHMQAAVIAMGGLAKPSIGADFDHWERLGKFEWVGDSLCELYRERLGEGVNERRFWVDSENGGLIRRYQGKIELSEEDFKFTRSSPLPFMLGSVLIEIDYEPLTRQPIGWIVVCCMTSEAPIVAFEYANVIPSKM